MKSVQCAAVDLGATSGRVIVGDWNGKRLLMTEVHRFPNRFRSLAGHEYWDLPGLWDEVRLGLIAAKRRFPRLASVGVDGWAVDHVLVNAKGRPACPVYAYRDKRTEAGSRRLAKHGMESIYALTGVPNYPYNTSLQLQETLTAFPSLARESLRCLFVPDYFNFLLSGQTVNELSIASHSQLLSVQGEGWSRTALDFFGIPRGWFGKPEHSPRRLGRVSGVPGLEGVLTVLVPGHDTACAYAAMPAAEDGSDLYLSSGTWSLVGFESETPLLGSGALEARISNERMGDGRYRPLKSCLGLWLLERILPEFGARASGLVDWKRIIAAAGRSPSSSARLDLSDAKLFNPPHMRTAIDAQLRRRGLRGPRGLAGYARLICDSLGHGHAQAADSFERLSGRRFRRILIVGGGSQNRLVCQATADASGLPVHSFSLEGSAVGNLAAQLVSLGAVADHATFRALFSRRQRATEFLPRTGPRRRSEV
ncbi:MAG TPA: FGGY-family carbohydrate kinase [Opitutaceae bacterium]